MLLTTLPSFVVGASSGAGPGLVVSLTFTPPLTDTQKADLAGKPLQLLTSTPAGQVTLATPAGQQLVATLTVGNGTTPATPQDKPALAQALALLKSGTPLTLAAGGPGNAAGALKALLPTTPLATGGVAARTLPVAANAPSVSTWPDATTAAPAIRVVLPSPAEAQSAPVAQVLAPQTPLRPGQAVLPPGPLAVNIAQAPQGPSVTLPEGPATLTFTTVAPASPATPRAAEITPTQGNKIPVTVTVGQPVPQGQTLPVVVFKPLASGTSPVPSPALSGAQASPPAPSTAAPQPLALAPVVLQTRPVVFSASQPVAAQAGAPPVATSLKVIVTEGAATTPPPPGLQLARVVGQPVPVRGSQNEGTATQQTILLANGRTGVVQSPQPLTTGTTLVVDIPSLTSAPSVVQVVPAGSQSGNQPQGAIPGTVSATPLATAQAVLPPGSVVKGMVTGQNDTGQLVLTLSEPPSYAGQSLTLTVTTANGQPENSAKVPVGTQLVLQLGESGTASASLVTMSLPAAVQNANTLAGLGTQWQALKTVVESLQQQSPLLAANLRSTLPQVENLLPNFILLVNALRSGKVEDFTGPQLAETLKTAAPGMVSDLNALQTLQQKPEAAPDGSLQWRGTLFPYVEGPLDREPKQGRFFWRREKSDAVRSQTSTRFVMELELSQTGPLQLDGLVQYPEVWMKLRRTTPPEEGFADGLRQVVNSLLQAYGLSGGVSVEVAPRFAVNPTQEILAAAAETNL